MDTYSTSVVVHIDENLTSEEIQQLEQEVCHMNGIVSAWMDVKTPHLMVVDYDPQVVESGMLLAHIQGTGVHPSLLGT